MQSLLKHLAVILDGNGRWANQRHLPRFRGHQAGVRAVRRLVEGCLNRQIPYLTLFVFSCENWRRPPEEVGFLMRLFQRFLQKERKSFMKYGIALKVIGDKSAFSEDLQKLMQDVEQETAHNTALTLYIAANYSGQWDIQQAVLKTVAAQVSGATALEVFQQALSLSGVPAPDLLIRTSGEQRISNFLLWDCAYTELYFTSCLWPDFKDADLAEALTFFETRQRRYGGLETCPNSV